MRKTPKDEWDVDMEEVKCAEHIEDIDDGEFVLRVDQELGKFKAMSDKAGSVSKEEMENMSSESEAQDRDGGENEGGPGANDDAGQSSSDDMAEDNCARASRCLLDDDLAPPGHKPTTTAAPSSQGTGRRPKLQL